MVVKLFKSIKTSLLAPESSAAAPDPNMARAAMFDISFIFKQNIIQKLKILLEQRKDLSDSIDQLLEDLAKGEKKMRVYKQMKMYNDETLNPVLYKKDD